MSKLPFDNLVPTGLKIQKAIKSLTLSLVFALGLFTTLVFNPTLVNADYSAPSCATLTINNFHYTIDSDLTQTQYNLGTNTIPEDTPITFQLNSGLDCQTEVEAQLAQADLLEPDTFWQLSYEWAITGEGSGFGEQYSYTFADIGQETLNFAIRLNGFDPNTGDSPSTQLAQTIFNLQVAGPPVIPDVTLDTVTIEFSGQRITIPENYNLKVDSTPVVIGVYEVTNQDATYLLDPTEFANLNYEWELVNITNQPFVVTTSTSQNFNFNELDNSQTNGLTQTYELTLTISDPNDSNRSSTDTIEFTTITSNIPSFIAVTEQDSIYDIPTGEGYCFDITLNPRDFADELFNPLFNSQFTFGIPDGPIIADQDDFTPENLTKNYCVSLNDLPNKFLPSLEFRVQGLFEIDNGDHILNFTQDYKPESLENLADFLSPDVVDLSIISRNSFQINLDENVGTKTDWSLGKVIPDGTTLDFAIYNPETAQFENCTEDRSGIYACLNLARPILADLDNPQTIVDVNNDLFTNPMQYEKSYFLFRPQDLTLATPNLNVIQFTVVPTYFFLTDSTYSTILDEIQVGQPNYFVLRDPVKSYDQVIADTEKVSLEKTPLFNLDEVGDTGVYKGSYTFSEITETSNLDLSVEVQSATLSTPILAKYQPPYLDKGLEYNGSESFRTPAPVITNNQEFSPYYFATSPRDPVNGVEPSYTNLNLEGGIDTYQNEPIFSAKNQGSALIYISNPELVSPTVPGDDAGLPPNPGGGGAIPGGGGAMPGGGGGMLEPPKGSLEIASLDQDIFLASTLLAGKEEPVPTPQEETLYPGLSFIFKNFVTEGDDTTYTYVYSLTSNLVQGWNRVNFFENNLVNTQSSPNEFLNADFDKITNWNVALLYSYLESGDDLELGLKDFGFYTLQNIGSISRNYLAVYTPPAPEPEPEPEPETPAPTNNNGTSSGSSAAPRVPQAPQAPNAPVTPQSPTLPSAPENPTSPNSPNTTDSQNPDSDETDDETDEQNNDSESSDGSSDDSSPSSENESNSNPSSENPNSPSLSQDQQFFFAPGTPQQEQTLENVQFEPIPAAELQACGERIQFYQQDGGIDTDGDGCSDGFEKAFGSDPTVANPASCSALTLANYASCETPQDLGQETRVNINFKASPTSTPGPQLFIPGTVELQSVDAVEGNQVCAALKGEFDFDLGCKPLEFIPSDNPDSKIANFNFLTEKFLKGTYNLVAYVKTLDGRIIQDFKQVNIGQPSNVNLELVELFGRPADQFNIKNLIAGNPDSAKFVQTTINPDDSVTVTFKTDSAVEVYWNSVVLTSAALADSTSGYVTVTVPKWFNLEPGSKHRLTAYAYDVANPTMLSQNIIVDFKVKGSYFPYLLALLGLMILLGVLIKVARSKSSSLPVAPIEPTIDDLTFKAVSATPTAQAPPSPTTPPTMPSAMPENPIEINPNNTN